jgi:hypothetical protein
MSMEIAIRLSLGSVGKVRDAGAGFAVGPGGRRTVGATSRGPQSGRALRIGFVLDVAGYGTRTVPERDNVQRRLRQLVVATLGECGLQLDMRVVDHQWTGDGINAVLPSDIDPPAVLSVLIRSLAAGLSTDNARHADRIRLRMAIGVGLIERRAAGFGGPVIVDINRLVDSAALRSALSAEPAADLAVAMSDQTYTLIIQPGYPGIPVGQFAQANVVAKEFSGPAWVWLSSRQWSEPAYLPLGTADPREVGGYRIVARLGSGQAGPVYLASGGSTGGSSGGFSGGFSDADPGWTALKVFDQGLVADPAVRRRLSLGAIAACVAREPHVASLIDSGVDDDQDQPWVATTLVRGPSLATAVAETGRLPADTSGWIALGLARALTTLHEAGFTHDAVSPPNVVLDAHGPVLTDLGMSRTTLISGPGTPGDDVLMLGATVFFAAAGRSPWGDGSARAVTAPPAAAAPPAPPATAGAAATADLPGDPDLTGCPSWLAPIVGACLAADPAARPAAAKLHAWLAGEIGQRPRSWLPGPVAARVTEYRTLPPSRGRFRYWPRGRDQ